jgi:hypothetical protein
MPGLLPGENCQISRIRVGRLLVKTSTRTGYFTWPYISESIIFTLDEALLFSGNMNFFVKTRMSDIFSGITGILADFFQRLVFHPLQVSAQVPHQFPITGIC